MLVVWVASRLAVLLLAGGVGVLLPDGDAVPYLDRWLQWDVRHYQEVATTGYVEPPSGTPVAAFFPGLPALMALVHASGLDLTAAGLAVSALAGAVAVLALARLAELDGPAGVGERAVALLVTSPAAIFLAAGYSESLFLALALPAWLAARRGRWLSAGILTGLAGLVRVSGVFLAVALVVVYLTDRRGGRLPVRGREVTGLALAFAGPAAFVGYLQVAQGDWLAWLHAQEEGWHRRFTFPWQALETTWAAAFGGTQTEAVAWAFRLELVAVLVGVVLTAVLLRRARWGEATFVGLQVAAMATSTWYFSVPRATLLWWPLWVLLAAATLRRRGLLVAYLAVSLPVCALVSAAFLTGGWAG